jgi:hypothetical protein
MAEASYGDYPIQNDGLLLVSFFSFSFFWFGFVLKNAERPIPGVVKQHELRISAWHRFL